MPYKRLPWLQPDSTKKFRYHELVTKKKEIECRNREKGNKLKEDIMSSEDSI
jgi:hypothetical protein